MIKPCHKKISLQGFELGPTQTCEAVQPQLMAKRLEILDLGSRGVVLHVAKNKAAGQLCGNRLFSHIQKAGFLTMRLN